MESNDVASMATGQHPTWQDFLERMRHPSAAELVKAIKSFIVSFSNYPPDSERDSAAVQQFLSKMEVAFRAHPLWAGCSEEELLSAGEGLEKYVMTKLFSRVFAKASDDVKTDEQLSEKMALVQQFIRPENLDIKPTFQNESSWLLAQKELQKINMYKAPREKLACILNCCKVITNLLHNAAVTAHENPPGADEFLPVLIYVTIKANPPQLHSNLEYIQRYRHQSRMVSETAYYFTNILSAVSFISNIDAQALSMDEAEFERNMITAQTFLSGLTSDYENTTNSEFSSSKPLEYREQTFPYNEKDSSAQQQILTQPSTTGSVSQEDRPTKDRSSITKNMSISDLEEKGASVILKDDGLNNVFQEFPFVFATVGDLTLHDVEDLLNNYKQVVFKYVCLAKGLGVTPLPPTSSVPQVQAQNLVETVKETELSRDAETHLRGTGEHDQSNESTTAYIASAESKLPQEDTTTSLLGEKEKGEIVSAGVDTEDVSTEEHTPPLGELSTEAMVHSSEEQHSQGLEPKNG